MDWPQVLTILGANLAIILAALGINIGLVLWTRTEANADHKRALDLIESIKDEMKDFHGRLCAIEEKYHQLRNKQENI